MNPFGTWSRKIDECFEPENVVKVAPDLRKQFDAIKQDRNLLDDLDHQSYMQGLGRSGCGWLRKVAEFPRNLLWLKMAAEPDFLQDKRKFYKWLDTKPSYQIRERKRPVSSAKSP